MCNWVLECIKLTNLSSCRWRVYWWRLWQWGKKNKMCSVPDDIFRFFCFAATHKSNFEFIIPTQSATQAFQGGSKNWVRRWQKSSLPDFYFSFLSSPLLSFFFSPFFFWWVFTRLHFTRKRFWGNPKDSQIFLLAWRDSYNFEIHHREEVSISGVLVKT